MPGSVLVVEDDAILGLSIEGALKDAGVAHVEIRASTETALEALKTHNPQAVILDVHLSDRDDGWAIAELIRSLGPKRPQIVFSTGAPEDIPADIAEMGAVLEKPYDLATLVDVLCQPQRRGLISRLRSALS